MSLLKKECTSSEQPGSSQVECGWEGVASNLSQTENWQNWAHFA